MIAALAVVAAVLLLLVLAAVHLVVILDGLVTGAMTRFQSTHQLFCLFFVKYPFVNQRIRRWVYPIKNLPVAIVS